jgi:hypothetical protein
MICFLVIFYYMYMIKIEITSEINKIGTISINHETIIQ